MKYIALCFSICYLANPSHQFIQTVLHEVSHIISPLNSTVSTSTSTQKEELHLYHEHDRLEAHNHKAINHMVMLINSFKPLDLVNETILSTDFIDKHISTKILTIPKILLTVFKGDDAKPVKKVIAGFLKIIDLPPQPIQKLTDAFDMAS